MTAVSLNMGPFPAILIILFTITALVIEIKTKKLDKEDMLYIVALIGGLLALLVLLLMLIYSDHYTFSDLLFNHQK